MSSDLDIFSADGKSLSDDWWHFLGALGTPNVVSDLTVDNSPPSTTGLPNLACDSPYFWGLQFNTAGNSSRFSQADYDVAGGALLGLSDSAKFTGVTFGDILDKFSITSTAYSGSDLVKAIIEGIGLGLKFQIDALEPRCALWLTPGQTLRADIALAFKYDPASGLGDIISAMNTNLGVNIDKILSTPTILLQRTFFGNKVTGSDKISTWSVAGTYKLTFKVPVGGFIFWVTLTPNGITCSLTPDRTTLNGDSIWDKLVALAGSGLSTSVISPVLQDILSNIDLLNLSVTRDQNGKFWWRVTTVIQWGTSTVQGAPIRIFLKYDSQTSIFTGGLVLGGFYTTVADRLLPTYDDASVIEPPTSGGLPTPYLDLLDLFSVEADTLPAGLPTAISTATVTYQKSTQSSLSLSARLVKPPAAPGLKYNVPTPFVWDELNISLTKSASFSCSLSTHLTLNPQNGDTYPPADLGLGITYENGSWSLAAYADNLSFGLLSGFLDQEYREALNSVLGKLTVQTLEVLCTFDNDSGRGSSTSFVFTGIITLGTLSLRLFYQYASAKAGAKTAASQKLTDGDDPQKLVVSGSPDTSDWRFECDLGASTGDATIGSILASFGDDISSLPAFLSGIQIPAATGRSPISIQVARTDDGKILFVLRISIEPVTLTFIQVGSKTEPTKRLLRFAVDKIPLIQNIPLLDQLPQPFQQLEYVWVSGNVGILESEVTSLNALLLSGQDSLLYKKVTADKPTAIAIQPGHHFMVVNDNKVAIDHIFSASPASPTPPPAASALAAVPSNKSTATADLQIGSNVVSPSPPAKGTIAFTVGPLSISAVTLQYKENSGDKMLCVSMDATLTLGPISFSLLGFSICLLLNADVHLDNLQALLLDIEHHIRVQLNGLALAFNKPPLLLAGGFEHQVIGSGVNMQDIYLGGIGLSFPPYTFVGLGEYAVLNDYKSVFIYAKLDGPLIELEFATISGVRLGLGFNSMVRSPTIDQLTNFPFINDAGTDGAGNDPIKILKSLTQSPSGDPTTDPAWVTPKLDSYWLAAGMTVTAFDILSITAVAMLAFRDSGFIVSIFADAVAQMPPAVPSKDEVIVYVEIGLVAEMNFIDGYFRVEASLAPTSFLLVPQCHISGGFALVYWFGANPHAGDWVFSVGGYHRSYVPPAWYPVPQRIGISFPVGDTMQVTGAAYFAITPKVAMGGALIHASLSVGPVNAWLDAVFDALVNFHPLHYIADFSVSVGVTCSMDIWFVHIHISVSVGAQLHIEGPEFGGHAYVDFYLFGFHVDFGASNQAPEPLNLKQFWEMLHTPGPNSTSIEKSDANPVQSYLLFNQVVSIENGAAHKFILENGNVPQPQTVNPDSKVAPTSTGAGSKWFVKGGTFQFRIATDFALTQATVAGSSDSPAISLDIADSLKNTEIYSRPMHVSSAISSELTVTIREKSSSNIISGWQGAAFTPKTVPTALWGSYDPALDPMKTTNPGPLLNGDAPNVLLPLGLMLSSPPPVLAVSFIPVFNAVDAAKLLVTTSKLAATEATQTEYIAAALTASQGQETNEQRWAETKVTWNGLKSKSGLVTDSTNGVLALCGSVLGWNQNRPQAETEAFNALTKSAAAKQGTVMERDTITLTSPSVQTTPKVSPPWQLIGTLPSKLISNIESLYLALPRLAVIND